MGKIAVIDTETTWNNRVMSIGMVIADGDTFQALDTRYYVLTPEYEIGGMFSNVMFLDHIPPKICSRQEALEEIQIWLNQHGVTAIFAYNAGFDKGHLPELSCLKWHDIMRLAAYRQHNPKIPCSAECFSTGRLKRGYGVEAHPAPSLRGLRLQRSSQCRLRCHGQTDHHASAGPQHRELH